MAQNLHSDIDATLLSDINALSGSLAQRVHCVLKQAILSMDFPPGAVLRKALICDHLKVSRAPVSEAIAKLADEGLVDVIPQSGTRVSFFSMDEIKEGLFLREALELAAVEKVSRDLTEEQRVALHRNIRLQQLLVEDGDIAGFYDADEEFHQMLMDFTGYGRLSTLAQTVSLQVRRARMLLLPTPGRTTETLDEHRAIFEAIASKDPAAAKKAMRHHLGQLMPRIEKHFEAQEDFRETNPKETQVAS